MPWPQRLGAFSRGLDAMASTRWGVPSRPCTDQSPGHRADGDPRACPPNHGPAATVEGPLDLSNRLKPRILPVGPTHALSRSTPPGEPRMKRQTIAASLSLFGLAGTLAPAGGCSNQSTTSSQASGGIG